ncbi:glycosyltransferase family 2 protein [Aeoliella sp. SH292]|uniref:glycosyltransferase family 2 protein n=1 Tax=Aeoliella sp. SH292 TaxID=3454464 RepID=UPI003F9DCF80
MVDLSILICTHNRAGLLAETLASLQSLRVPTNATVDLIVVANACTDDTQSVAERAFAEIPFSCRLVAEPVPGLSVARNRAVDESTGRICAFLDDDVQVAEGWLSAMMDAFEGTDVAIATGRVQLWWKDIERPAWMNSRCESYLSCRDLGDRDCRIESSFLVIGCNFAFLRSVYEQIGPFRTDLGRIGLGMLAGEETEFSERAMKRGSQIAYVANAAILHYVSPQRATIEYLLTAAYGRGVSNSLTTPTHTWFRFGRQALGQAWLMLQGTLERVAGVVTNNPSKAISGALLAAIGRGGFAGMYQRMRRKSRG